MRQISIFLIGFIAVFPLGCTFSPNPLNWFKSTPEEERFTYSPPETPPEEAQREAGAAPESITEALAGPETPAEALMREPSEGVVAVKEPPTFTFIYYARGPAGRAKASSLDKPEPNAVYQEAKEAHMVHNLEEGVYASYYQHIRNRIKSHWNFLYSDIGGMSYVTQNNRPITVDAK
ncbi:MAG: hypothetical protein ACE5KK_05595, partial [Candidatus Brocadiales bacterium]